MRTGAWSWPRSGPSHRRWTSSKQLGKFANACGRYAQAFTDLRGCIVLDEHFQCVPVGPTPIGALHGHMFVDKVPIHESIAPHDVSHRPEQEEVATRSRCKVDIRVLCGHGSAGIHADNHRIWMHPTPGQDALKERLMTLGWIGTDDEEYFGVIDVLIGTRGLVLTKGLGVAHSRGGHAEPWIAIDVVGAKPGLEQLVGCIALFYVELTRAVIGDR